MHYFYILRCSDNTLYCGMTKNLKNRLKEHNSNSAKGAKYLRGKKPVSIVYFEKYPDIKSAMGRELEVKKWPKVKKEALVEGTFGKARVEKNEDAKGKKRNRG